MHLGSLTFDPFSGHMTSLYPGISPNPSRTLLLGPCVRYKGGTYDQFLLRNPGCPSETGRLDSCRTVRFKIQIWKFVCFCFTSLTDGQVQNSNLEIRLCLLHLRQGRLDLKFKVGNSCVCFASLTDGQVQNSNFEIRLCLLHLRYGRLDLKFKSRDSLVFLVHN